jgi:hypothetical protein
MPWTGGSVLAALVLLIAFAVPLIGRAASDPMCMGQHGVAGWSTKTVRCTLATAGDSLSIRTTITAAGTYTSFLFPFPPIVNAGVSIKDSSGTTLLSCSHTDIVLSQCGERRLINVPIGTLLTCVATGWTNMTYGKARLTFACMSR